VARLTGKNGAIYLAQSTTKLGDTFMWEYEQNLEVAECSIKQEAFGKYVPNMTTARVRAQTFVSAGSPFTSAMFGDIPPDVTGRGAPVNFLLSGLDGSNTTVLVQGGGWIVRSQLHVARDGLITDDMEIQVEGDVAITIV
jgi:hypothetical protein